MSFARSYFPLFRISLLNHSTGEAISGAKLSPSRDCAKLLANHQLLTKERDYGLDVFYSTNPRADEPLLAAFSGLVQFDFQLHLPMDFFKAYLPNLSAEPGRSLHLQNRDAGGNIQQAATNSLGQSVTVGLSEAVTVQPMRFELSMDIDASATSFQVSTEFDNTPLLLDGLKIDNTGLNTLTELDLTVLAGGRYRIATDTQPTQYRHLLLDNELAASRAQGLISIYLNQAQDLAPMEGYQFEARFDPR